LAFAAVQILSFRRLARLPPERRGLLGQLAQKLMPQGPRETLIFTALAATAGVCEEFLYRGFVFAAVERATGSIAVAGLASSVLFAVAHFYQGARGVISTFGAGLIFVAARMATGSLVAPVAAHFFADVLAGLAAARYLTPASTPVEASPTR
ncbi:MAG TPA: CPBP family intramembrane glutamic endopeptidase, partial [Anaerolineales bacterium]